jgi:hypothetical protein
VSRRYVVLTRQNHLLIYEHHPARYRAKVWNFTTPVCGRAERLLDAYTAALAVFHDARQTLLAGPDPTDSQYARMMEAKEEAFANLRRARDRYWCQIGWHGCRKGIGELLKGAERASLTSLKRRKVDCHETHPG